MTALAMDVRELTWHETEIVGGGPDSPTCPVDPGMVITQSMLTGHGDVREFAGCAISLAGMGITFVGGIFGPADWMLFGLSTFSAINDCIQ